MKRTLVEGSSTMGRVSCSLPTISIQVSPISGRADTTEALCTPGMCGSLFEHTLEERGAFGRFGVFGGEQREIHGEDAIHLKAFVDGHETDEAGDEQSGGDQQRGAETHFEADQEVAHAQSAAAFGIAAARPISGSP